MMKIWLIAFIIFIASAERYALLLSASTGYHNYRHQANICHTYHSLIQKGVPEQNIVLFSYDDAVHSYENPFPGKLFTQPGLNPQNVNAGCKKDYTFEEVHPKNFLYALTGDYENVRGGSGRVLNTTEQDNIFVYISTSSGPGFLTFPEGRLLYASVLNAALLLMKQNNRFNNLVFFLDSSEAGAMFHRLINRQANVYAVVGSASNESSFATYCPPEDKVNGISMRTCLGTDFSSEFFELIDQANITGVTLNQWFIKQKERVKTSEVQEFGTLQIGRLSASDFMGNWVINTFAPPQPMPEKSVFQNSHDVKLDYLFNQYLNDSNIDTADELIKEIFNRELVTDTFRKFAQKESINPDYLMFLKEKPKNFECLSNVVDSYIQQCGELTDFSSQFMQILINVCEADLNHDQIINDLVSECIYNLDEMDDEFDIPYWLVWEDYINVQDIMDVLNNIQDEIDTREYVEELIDEAIKVIIDREVDYLIETQYGDIPGPLKEIIKAQLKEELYQGEIWSMLRENVQDMISDQMDVLVDYDMDSDFSEIQELIYDYVEEVYGEYDSNEVYQELQEFIDNILDDYEEEEKSLIDEIEEVIKNIINNIPNPFGN